MAKKTNLKAEKAKRNLAYARAHKKKGRITGRPPRRTDFARPAETAP